MSYQNWSLVFCFWLPEGSGWVCQEKITKMLVQQANGKAAWVGNGSRNVSAEEEAAGAERDSEEEQQQEVLQSFPLHRRHTNGSSSGLQHLGYCQDFLLNLICLFSSSLPAVCEIVVLIHPDMISLLLSPSKLPMGLLQLLP